MTAARVTVISLAVLASAPLEHAVPRGNAGAPAGRYELFLCRRRCAPGDTGAAYATGYIVLGDRPLVVALRDSVSRGRLEDTYAYMGRPGTANGCVVLSPTGRTTTYATIYGVALTRWRVARDSGTVFELYHSPDAGYVVTRRVHFGYLYRTRARVGSGPLANPDPAGVGRRAAHRRGRPGALLRGGSGPAAVT